MVYVSSVVSQTTILIPYEEAIAAAGVKARRRSHWSVCHHICAFPPTAQVDPRAPAGGKVRLKNAPLRFSPPPLPPQGRTMFQHAAQPLTAETLVATAESVGADFIVRPGPGSGRWREWEEGLAARVTAESIMTVRGALPAASGVPMSGRVLIPPPSRGFL